jgi:hypothetical protein
MVGFTVVVECTLDDATSGELELAVDVDDETAVVGLGLDKVDVTTEIDETEVVAVIFGSGVEEVMRMDEEIDMELDLELDLGLEVGLEAELETGLDVGMGISAGSSTTPICGPPPSESGSSPGKRESCVIP